MQVRGKGDLGPQTHYPKYIPVAAVRLRVDVEESLMVAGCGMVMA